MQALKDVALRLLNVYVSPYVENLNPHDLSVSVFGGNLQFHDLHLKKTLLERFGLPIDIVAGDIGTLSVTIPWTQLKNQPVKIAIDNVYVLAQAKPQGKVDAEEDERVEQATKQEKLKSAEAVDNAAAQVGGTGGNDEAKQTYIGAIISKVVDNVQIHVKNIHVRYEDRISTPEHPFAAGVTLSEFKAVSTDSNWMETFIQDSLQGVHKLVKLGALSVYFDTDTDSVDKGPDDREGTLDALHKMLIGDSKHQYILKPVTGEARLILNKNMTRDSPKYDAQVIFDEIGVVVDRDQYRDVLSMVDVIHFYKRTHEYHKFRPPEVDYEGSASKARWKFALNAIGTEVRERHRRWTWEYMAERREKRIKYVEIYARKLGLPEGKQLSPDDDTQLAEMERDLSYEDIRYFRSVARAQAKKDAATRRKLEAEKRKAQPQRQTWSEWLWGVPKDDDGMTEEEQKEIDEIIDYDRAAAPTIDSTPNDFMNARVSASLHQGSLALRVDPHGKCVDIIALVFDSFSANVVQLTESVSGKIALGGFRVYDGTTPDSLYPQIVRVKDIESSSPVDKGKSRQTSLDDAGGTEGAMAEIDKGLDHDVDPFFVMEVEQNPLDGHADSCLTVRMRHLEIVYHKGYVEAVYQFLKPPASQLESVGALMDAAGQTLEGFRKETRAGLEYALEQHKTVDLRVDMNAPIIIVPMDIKSKDSQAIVLDAGHIAVESQLADKNKLKEVQSKRGRQYSQEDFKQLEDLMYDKLSLRLEAAQLLMGSSVEACMKAVEDVHGPSQTDLHLLERINISFTVQNAIAKAQSLTSFKIAGELPELRINFSDTKYKLLMRFIDSTIPDFGDDSPPEEIPRVVERDTHQSTFRPRPVEEYNLEDTKSILSVNPEPEEEKDDGSSSSEKGGDRFYDTHDDTTDVQRQALQKVNFELSFSVGKLQTSLYRSTSETEERALADATLEGFGLALAVRQYDMTVDVDLRSVTLSMMGQNENPRPLLSSISEKDQQPNRNLLHVKYSRVKKESPEYMTIHEGVDQGVDVELSTFAVTIAPEPILSLYDFIMTTFVSRDSENGSPEPAKQPSTADVPQQPVDEPKSSDKIRVRVKITTASVSLENNDDRFALLTLPSADVALLLRNGSLRIGARLGDLMLEDTSSQQVANPEFKRLLSIEGEELADFSYETYDPTDEETFPGFNSSIHLRAGSLKFTFLEGPIRALYVFAMKFARMKALYDTASQAAVQRASGVTRMRYDIVVKTPIIVLPENGVSSKDLLNLRLGQIIAKNNYLGDASDTSTIKASISGINVSSEIWVDDKQAVVQMIEDVAITAKVKQAGKRAAGTKSQIPDEEITTEMSEVKLSLTQRQYMLLMSVVGSIPRVLSDADVGDISPESIPGTPSRSVSIPATPVNEEVPLDHQVNLEPELAVVKSPNGTDPDVWTSRTVTFSVKSIALEIYAVDAHHEDELQKHSIARFALVQSKFDLQQLSDGAMSLNFALKTLSFTNTRTGNSVFRELVPPAAHDGNQIMVSYTLGAGLQKSALAIVTIDSPRFTLAVDPLAALLEFAMSPFKKDPTDVEEEEEDDSPSNDEVAKAPQSSTPLAFRVEVIDATVVVLADDSDPRSQAIHLSIKEILLSQQAVLAVKVERLGMSFGRMDKPNDRVNFLDQLNIALSLDTRQRGAQQMTNCEIDIPDTIIFRASLSDIMLILDIVNKAMAAAQTAQKPANDAKDDRRTSIAPDGASSTVARTSSKVARTAKRSSVITKRRISEQSKVLVSKEQLKARIKGFQFVLVGDLQELPFVHLISPEFELSLNDWSGDLRLATSIQTQIRYFNLTNSYFEPLLDPWTFQLRVSRTTAGAGSQPLNVWLSASERLELTLTSAFIELAITSITLWSKNRDLIKQGKREDAPFRIRNRTGYRIYVWPEQRDPEKEVHGVRQLDDGAEFPWWFEKRKHIRENVSAARHNALGLRMEHPSQTWDNIRFVSVDRAGEYILPLKPKIDKVQHLLMCEIHLENNIKVITFRSTLNVENETSLPIEMIIVDSHGKAAGGAMKIDPGSSCAIPVEAAYDKRFRIRPLRGFGFDYNWSMPLHWKQLVARPIRPISCKHQTAQEPAFYFQAQANFDSKDPTARSYPKMKLVLRAPVELENLLPCDLQFRMHDKNTGLSSSNFLSKGGTSPIHTVELSHLLLLSVKPLDTGFKQSDYAIINTDDPELPIEKNFTVVDEHGVKLTLRLHYYTFPQSGSAFKVQIYSPFIFMNKTGLSFDLASNTWTGGQKAVAGSSRFANDYKRDEPTPFLFGYSNEDRRNRLYVQVDDSKWSKPVSFEPVAADMQLVMQAQNQQSDYYVGLSYTEGLGKYKLTKVITIAPRFIVKNMFSYALRVRQSSTQNVFALSPGDRVPIHQLQSRAPLQMTVAMDDHDMKWTAPFSMSDIGRTNLVIERQTNRGPKTYLLRVETHLEGSTVFTYVSRETEPWPLRLENQTNVTFTFQQADDVNAGTTMPLRDINPHSSVDYAWDYPDNRSKRIRLLLEGVPLPQTIDMMAIGVQPPVKVAPRQQGKRSTVVSLDIQADGNSQVLVITPYNEDTSIYKPTRRNQAAMRRTESTDSLPGSAFETVQVSEKPHLQVTVEFEGIGVSVVTKRLDELLYLSIRGLKLGYSDYPQYHDAYLDCKWVQIDNQLFGGLFPIILYPTVVPKDGKELESHPTLQTSLAILKDTSHGVFFIKYATILLQAMTIELDEDFVFALLEFVKFPDASWKEPSPDVLIEYPKDIPEPDIASAAADVFFEALQLQPVSLEISFMRTDRVNVDEKVSNRNPFYFALNALTMTLGNINAAPVNFRALFLENVRLSVPELEERVKLHYQEQLMPQLYRVLGSADFLGNPVGLFNNISSGFSDIFYEPYQGMVMHGNKDIGLGIARGATSFAKKTVFGITDSMTKFTSSIGKGLSVATLDAEYQNKRRMTQRRNKPKHALYGVAAGASAFADSVTSAFEGVASKPIEGAERGGAAGFAKGVGKGVVGLFTKPAVGVMDFLSASTEGIRNTTTVFDQADIDRVRLPRFIGSDGVLRPFNDREGLGQSWLKELNAGAYFHESYVAHLDIPGDDAVALLSDNRLLHVQLRKMRVNWEAPFEHVQSLSLEPSGISITLRDGVGGIEGPFLAISEQTGREWFFKQIRKVVIAYNKLHASRDD